MISVSGEKGKNKSGMEKEQGWRTRVKVGLPMDFRWGSISIKIGCVIVKHDQYLRTLEQQKFISGSFYMSVKVTWNLHCIC